MAFKFIYGFSLLVIFATIVTNIFTNNANHLRKAIKTRIVFCGLYALTVIYNFGFNGLYFFVTAIIVLTVLFIVIQKSRYCSFCGRLIRFEKIFTLFNYCPKCDGNKKSQSENL